MRSKLFVPCTRPDFFAKALAGDADAISFDLEDAVPETGKTAARAALGEVLRSDAVVASAKRIVVRVNALGTPHFDDDLAALRGGRVDLVNLPKVDTTDTVRAAAERLDAADIEADLLLTIESPRGLAGVAAIAHAHPRVAGLQAGLNDLFGALGMARREPRNVHAALWALRLGSAAGGRDGQAPFVYDGAWPDLADTAGFEAEAQLARDLGFLGKSCVHPRQVPIANAVFDRCAARDRAGRLLAAAAHAAADGIGAFRFEGTMVDAPMIAAARALLRTGHGTT